MTTPPPRPPTRPRLTAKRLLVWIVVSFVGVFLLVSGIIGVLAKG